MKFELNRLPEDTDDALISEVRRVANMIGAGRFTIVEFSKHSKVCVSTLRRRFGSWPGALEAAGLPHLYIAPAPATRSRVLARSFSKKTVIQNLRTLCERCNLGKSNQSETENAG